MARDLFDEAGIESVEMSPFDAVRKVAAESGYNPEYLVGLAKLETRGGDATIKGGGVDTFNLFNVKDFSGKGTGIRAHDKAEGSNDRYRQYDSHEESVRDLVSLLDRRYPGAKDAKTASDFAQALKDGGYATDPNYVGKLARVIGQSAGEQQAPSGRDLFEVAGIDSRAEEGRDLFAAFGVNPKASKSERKEVPGMSAGSVAQDIASGVLQIAPTAIKGMADIARLATGDTVGKDLSDRMEADIKKIQGEYGSERGAAQRENFQRDMADDGVGIGEALLRNKGALADQLLPTVGSMFLPVGVAGAAGKLASVGQAAQAMDKAALVARVALAQKSAGIGAVAAQNAADTFAELLEKGASMSDAYLGAGITVPFSVVAGVLTGGGAEGAITRALTGIGIVKTGVTQAGKAALREGAQEMGEEAGQITGEAVGTGVAPSSVGAGKRMAVAGTLGFALGGGVDVASQLGSGSQAAELAGVTPGATATEQTQTTATAVEGSITQPSPAPIAKQGAMDPIARMAELELLAQSRGLSEAEAAEGLALAQRMQTPENNGSFGFEDVPDFEQSTSAPQVDADAGPSQEPTDFWSFAQSKGFTPGQIQIGSQLHTELKAEYDALKAGNSESAQALQPGAPVVGQAEPNATKAASTTSQPFTNFWTFAKSKGYKPGQVQVGTELHAALKAEFQAQKASKVQPAGVLPTVPADGQQAAAPAVPAAVTQSGIDPSLQNRDRSRAASVAQMYDIARNPDYMRLGTSRTPDAGAPMVFAVDDYVDSVPQGNEGHSDVAVMSDGQRVPFRYAVLPAEKVQPSHMADGSVNPQFQSQFPGTLKALNNGRTAGLRAAYDQGTAERYRQELIADAAAHGVPAEVIQRTRNPILVRVYSEKSNTPDMAAKSQAQGLGMSPAELARQDAPLIDANTLAVFQPGDVTSAANRDFVRAFVGRLHQSGQDVGTLMTADGTLSPAGRQRIQAALMQAAYGDADLVGELFDSLDTDIKAIGEALKTVAGEWANMRDSARQGLINPDNDITDNLIQAVNLIKKARRERSGLDDLTNQPDLMTGETPDPLTVGALRLFYKGRYLTLPVGRDSVIAMLRDYVRTAMATTSGADMFGQTVTPSDILSSIIPTGLPNAQDSTQESSRSPNGSGNHVGGAGPTRYSEQGPGSAEAGGGTGQYRQGQREDTAGADGWTGSQADQGNEATGLTTYTAQEVTQRQDTAEAANRQAEAERKAADAVDAQRRERAEVARLSQGAADDFQLGQDPMDSLTGQRDVFDQQQQAATEPTVRETQAAIDRLKVGMVIHSQGMADSVDGVIESIKLPTPDDQRFQLTIRWRDAGVPRPGKAAGSMAYISGLYVRGGQLFEHHTNDEPEAWEIRTSTADSKPATRNEDVGQQLYANRRNFTGRGLTWSDVSTLNDTLKVKEVTKAKVWPRPNYEQLVADGTPPVLARMVKQVYDGISAGPTIRTGLPPTDADLKLYIDTLAKVREGLFGFVSDRQQVAEFAKGVLTQVRGEPTVLAPVSILDMSKTAMGAEQVATVLLRRVWPDEMTKPTMGRFSRGSSANAELAILGGNKALGNMQFTRRDISKWNADLGKGWPGKREAWEVQGYRILAPGEYVGVGQEMKDGTSRMSIRLKEGRGSWRANLTDQQLVNSFMLVQDGGFTAEPFTTREAATEAAREKVKRSAGAGQDIRGTNIENAERTGPARRQEGDDVTSQRLMDAFGFRGVNFGREGWINQAERQAYLNQAYDGLLDLADVLGVPPKAISLDGALGIAFGAQGKGENAAHFMAGVNEINLTKTKGAGTLAHEWGHALDHHFANQAGLEKLAEPFLSEHASKPDTTSRIVEEAGKWVNKKGIPTFGEGIRPEIVQAFRAIHQAMEKRNESIGEAKTRRDVALERARKQLAGWIKAARRVIEDSTAENKADLLAEFDQHAEKLAEGDTGDGYQKAGNQLFSTRVAAVRNLIKDATGRVWSKDETNGLESNARYVNSLLGKQDADADHVPQQISTQYRRDSLAMDKEKGGKAYWGTSTEMFARAFELYVHDKLSQQGTLNTFLTDAERRAATPVTVADTSSAMARGAASTRDLYLYPVGKERETLREAFDNLVGQIKTRETESGGVTLFNRKDGYSNGNDTDTQPSNERNQRDIADLESIVDDGNRAAIAAASARSARAVHPFRWVQVPGIHGLGPIAAAFGKRVVGFEVTASVLSKEFGFFNGVTRPGADGRIYLNKDADRPHLAVLGHELGHQLKRDRPDLYAQMVTAIRPYIKAKEYGTDFAQSSVARNSYAPGATADKRDAAIREEFIGEVLSDGFMDRGFWQALGTRNPGLLKSVVQFVTDLIATVKAAVGINPRTAKYLTDFDRVMQIAGEAMGQYGMDPSTALTGSGGAAFQRVFHGTPHRGIDKFSTDKVGTGEGAQAYGWGLYFASKEAIADHYRKGLSYRDIVREFRGELPDDADFADALEAAKTMSPHRARVVRALAADDWLGFDYPAQAITAAFKELDNFDASPELRNAVNAATGQLYEVEIPEDSDMLLWDKPLSDQPDANLLREIAEGEDLPVNYRKKALHGDRTGQDFYKALSQQLGSDESASRVLNSYGVKGIKYLDGTSRDAGEGSHNFVIFDGADTEIVATKFNRNSLGATPPQQPGPRQQNAWTTAKAKVMQLTSPEAITKLIYEFQDKLVDLKNLRDHIKALGGTISDLNDAYLGEELFHKRLAKRTEDFLDREMKPLLAAMRANSVGMAEFERYLHARHAPEANKVLADRNPNQAMIDAGKASAAKAVRDLELQLQRAKAQGSATKAIQESLAMAMEEAANWHGAQAFRGTEDERLSLSGMSDAEAQAFMNSLPTRKADSLKDLADMVSRIQSKTLDALENYGLMDAASLNTWRSTYQFYVPLHRDEAHADSARHPSGQGFSVKGAAVKRRVGSNEKVTNILAHIAMQRESVLTRGEKNHVVKKLYLMAAQNPDADFWQIDSPPMIKSIDSRTGFVRKTVDPQFKHLPNVVMVRIAGKDQAVVFNEHNPQAVRLAEAMKNLDVGDLHVVLGMTAKGTRWFASVNTQYNPIFGLINFARDVQSGLLNLSTTELAGHHRAVTAKIMPAMRAIYRERRGKSATSQQWSKLWEEFQDVGGTTGYRDMFADAKDRSNALTKELAAMDRGEVSKAAHAVVDWLSDYNETMENSVRLAAYQVALDQGMTKERAASLAKNLTVNFNRKGRQAREIGALYAFFNAAIQGTTRMVETLRGPVGKRIMYGGVLLGAVNALIGMAMMGADDDDEADNWDQIPEFIKERSIVIPMGREDYLTIPMPLGFHVFPNIGRIAVEFAMGNGDKSAGKQLGKLLMVMADAFNPLGGSQNLGQMVSPTVIDPVVALMQNRDWTGKPIYRENPNGLDPQPGHAMAKDSASTPSRLAAEAINRITGGTEFRPGAWSPTPDQLDYVIGQLSGGLGRELLKVNQTVASQFTGDDLPPYKIPLVGRLYGNTRGQAGQSERYYENIKLLNELENELQGWERAGRDITALEKSEPLLDLVFTANAIETEIRNLRKARRNVVEDKEPGYQDEARQIDTEIGQSMAELNKAVAKTLREHDGGKQ